jgi:hypothetical protein
MIVRKDIYNYCKKEREFMEKKILILCFIFILSGLIAILGVMSVGSYPEFSTYDTDYWDFYSPISDIYIKEMVPSGNGSIVYFYPDGDLTFSFATNSTIRKEIKNHFIECTKTAGYITITDTDIPFLPKINPFAWGILDGDTDDFKTMRDLFKTPREGACYTQVDFMVRLANKNGIITRRINLWQSPGNGILTAGGHTTMETYDRRTKQWIWMDPLYNITEGKIGYAPLTLHDFRIAINRNANVTLVFTDGKEIGFNQWEYSRIWKNYLNPSQRISYIIP